MDRVIKANDAAKIPMYSIEVPTIGTIHFDDLAVLSRLAMCFVVMANEQPAKELREMYMDAYNTCMGFLNDNLYFQR